MTQTVAIIGGGMVGATLALLFDRYLPTLKVHLLDQSLSNGLDASPSFDERSTAIAPSTQQCFAELGLWPHLQHYATAIHRIAISDKGHLGQGQFDQADNDNAPLGYVLSNRGLGSVLASALAQSAVNCRNDRVASVQVSGRGANLTTEVGESIDGFDLVIIADGAQSGCRESLGITAEYFDYQQVAMVANVRHRKAHNHVAYERFCKTGPIALLPRGQRATSTESALVWTLTPSEHQALVDMNEAERLQQLQQAFGYRVGRFQAMSEPSFYPLTRVLAKEQVRQHVVVMGNAAHFLHPVAGQGFNLSVRDSLQLIAALRAALQAGQSIGDLTVLNSYAERQAPDQRNTQWLSQTFHKVFTSPLLPVQLARTAGFGLLEINPLVRSVFIEMLSGRATPKAQLEAPCSLSM